MHVGHAGARERGQMLHAVGAGLGECEVLAAMRRTHGRIVGGEIADVQFIDRHVFLRVDGLRRVLFIPAGRLETMG